MILDARLAFSIVDGFAITFAFATNDELERWSKMRIPKEPNLIQKVTEMKSKTIGVNFTFEDRGLS